MRPHPPLGGCCRTPCRLRRPRGCARRRSSSLCRWRRRRPRRRREGRPRHRSGSPRRRPRRLRPGE
ncbi:MAG: hypothetical protein CVU63_12855 [Deltaproteobacteria bacterium HGW-Deltaproteobacteria-20]|nr:MAG: hypothetical protein CVU63_12855 [Deltaproteobacteria bacterium HGW-Deltaproteobacteria-20]